VSVLQDVDGAIELNVLFFFALGVLRARGLVALRSGRPAIAGGRILVVLLLPVLEMMRQIALVNFRVLVELPALLGYRCERLLGQLDVDVRRDSHSLARAASRRVVARRRQTQRRMIVERKA